jgi:hypothetical protein
VLRVEVIEHGRVLVERDAETRARCEMQALSRYAYLNSARITRPNMVLYARPARVSCGDTLALKLSESLAARRSAP